MKHTKTDPACHYYRKPRTPWTAWKHKRARGRGCHVCVPPIQVPGYYLELWAERLPDLCHGGYPCTVPSECRRNMRCTPTP